MKARSRHLIEHEAFTALCGVSIPGFGLLQTGLDDRLLGRE